MKKALVLLTVWLLLTATLAGCHGGADSSTPYSQVPPTTESVPSTTSASSTNAQSTSAPSETTVLPSRTATTATTKAVSTVDRTTLKESAVRFFNTVTPATLFKGADAAVLDPTQGVRGLSLTAESSSQTLSVSWARKGDYEYCRATEFSGNTPTMLETITHDDGIARNVFTTDDGKTWHVETVNRDDTQTDEDVHVLDMTSLTFPKITASQLAVYDGKLYLDNRYLEAFVEKNLGPLTGAEVTKMTATEKAALLASAKKTLGYLHLSVTISTTRNLVSRITIKALPTDEDAKKTGIASLDCRIDLTADGKRIHKLALSVKEAAADTRISYTPTSTLHYTAIINDGEITGSTIEGTVFSAEVQNTGNKPTVIFRKTHLTIQADRENSFADRRLLASFSFHSQVDRVYKPNSRGVIAVVDSRLNDRYGNASGFDLLLTETEDNRRIDVLGYGYGTSDLPHTLYGEAYLGEPQNFPNPLPPYVTDYIANRKAPV